MNDDEDLEDLLRFFSEGGMKLTFDDMRDDVREIKEEIDSITKKGFYLTPRDRRILRELEEELEMIQSRCHHSWEVVTLFSHVRQFCSRCDLENKSYRHVR